MAAELAERLKRAVAEQGRRLRELSDAEAATRSSGEDGWSRKQELGHLLDSATNNRARFIVAALQGHYTGPTYDGMGWVDVGGYADSPWLDLIELWERLNSSLAIAIRGISEDRLPTKCKVGNGEPVTLEFLIDDYILHMQHHLDHIFSRENLTSYPGAAVGV